ncbi:hypothetical protein EDB84DRAFT_1436390 [Lactarius hengduanensis]|nr:hypothetical protein EDB84DRAFT_1436390 [Lactarius hengduanensis]
MYYLYAKSIASWVGRHISIVKSRHRDSVMGAQRHVGIDGPWGCVGVGGPRRHCRWAMAPHGYRRATVPCCYATFGVDGLWRCVGVEVPRRRVVLMGHGAVSLRCVGVDTPRGCRRATAPCRYATWESSVSMGHGADVGVEVPRRRVGVEGPQHRVGVEVPRRRVGVDGPRRCVVTLGRVGVDGPWHHIGVKGSGRRVGVEVQSLR